MRHYAESSVDTSGVLNTGWVKSLLQLSFCKILANGGFDFAPVIFMNAFSSDVLNFENNYVLCHSEAFPFSPALTKNIK